MWVIIIAVAVIAVLVGGIYYISKHSSTSRGQCVYVTASSGSGNYVCNCAKGDIQDDCASKQGLYDQAENCSGDFMTICETKLLGSCVTTSSCTFPTTKEDCKGTWSLGNSCK